MLDMGFYDDIMEIINTLPKIDKLYFSLQLMKKI